MNARDVCGFFFFEVLSYIMDVMWFEIHRTKYVHIILENRNFPHHKIQVEKERTKKKTVKFFFPCQIIKCTIESRVLSPNSNTCILFFFSIITWIWNTVSIWIMKNEINNNKDNGFFLKKVSSFIYINKKKGWHYICVTFTKKILIFYFFLWCSCNITRLVVVAAVVVVVIVCL